jgi:thiol-disulfide isomerase/thioredoxin
MKYLLLLLCSLLCSKLSAQKQISALPRIDSRLVTQFDSILTQPERDSFKHGLIPYVLQIRFDKYEREYTQKRDSFLKTLEGRLVPDFEAQDTSGLVHRPANYRGRVVILHFWNFWDYSFQNEIPYLNEIIEKYGKDGVKILSFVDLTLGASEKAFLEKTPVYFPIIENAYKFANAFLPFHQNKPYIVFIDKFGRMRYFLTHETLNVVKSNINEKVMGVEKKPITYSLEDKIVQLLKE